jgi:hypothetical protein
MEGVPGVFASAIWSVRYRPMSAPEVADSAAIMERVKTAREFFMP